MNAVQYLAIAVTSKITDSGRLRRFVNACLKDDPAVVVRRMGAVDVEEFAHVVDELLSSAESVLGRDDELTEDLASFLADLEDHAAYLEDHPGAA